MTIRTMTGPEDLQRYDDWIKAHPAGSLWQSLEWKQYQEALGREGRIYVQEEGSRIVASALVIIDRTSFGLSTWEIPRGPVWELKIDNEQLTILLKKIIEDARLGKAMILYCTPCDEIANFQFSIVHCQLSPRHQQPEATRIIDLTQSEEQILAQMHPKGRYNIKVAEKNGVTVQQSADIDAYYELAKQTAGRDGFTMLPKKQYQAFLKNLPGSFLLLAFAPKSEVRSPKSESPIAGLLGTTWNGQGMYYYGASSYAHRALMAPYLLQWEAMKRCKAQGCKEYDLLGIAPPGATTHKTTVRRPGLPACRTPLKEGMVPGRETMVSLPGIDHPWQGISGFKEKFGGRIITYPPEQMVVLRPVVHWALNIKRKWWQ